MVRNYGRPEKAFSACPLYISALADADAQSCQTKAMPPVFPAVARFGSDRAFLARKLMRLEIARLAIDDALAALRHVQARRLS